ncbi:hypothetical protein [Listeria innocua]|uniref:hypothetical protein n=1 Tax=Listeria innocua TaxID=1642 RepID=UPI0016285270|nr:hypothetical protein [Listeria innocua]MBC1925551.1 hypothetical protein [Listeria innocua]
MEKPLKTSKIQRRASQRYRDKLTPEQRAYNSAKSASRTFARKHAKSQEDILEIVKIYLQENPNAEKDFQKLWQELTNNLS